ncbi:hypothetical protein TNCV_1134761 [Trichonephila clavipes]|nr:hypothetical protein TNCV_1134761 [Trichonephila clavipes]
MREKRKPLTRCSSRSSHTWANQAVNPETVHSSLSSNHKAAFQPFQDGLFYQFDFVSKFLIATPFLHVPTTNQAVSSYQGLLLPQAPLITMIWDGGSLRGPYAQRQL